MLRDFAEHAVHEAPAIFGRILLGKLNRLVDRHGDRHLSVVQQFPRREPQHRAVNVRHSVKRPTLGITRDQLIDLIAMIGDAVNDLASVQPRGHAVWLAGGAFGFSFEYHLELLAANVSLKQQV